MNNEKITGSRPLLPDQLLTLGNVTFRAVYEVPDIDLDEIQQNADVGSWTDDGQQGETIASEVLALQLAQVGEDAVSKESHVIVVDQENPPNDPSISLGAINQLPKDENAVVESSLDIDVAESETVQPVQEDVSIDTGEDTKEKVSDDGTLDSFIRKLPK